MRLTGRGEEAAGELLGGHVLGAARDGGGVVGAPQVLARQAKVGHTHLHGWQGGREKEGVPLSIVGDMSGKSKLLRFVSF